jgi:hypothetical protein
MIESEKETEDMFEKADDELLEVDSDFLAAEEKSKFESILNMGKKKDDDDEDIDDEDDLDDLEEDDDESIEEDDNFKDEPEDEDELYEEDFDFEDDEDLFEDEDDVPYN